LIRHPVTNEQIWFNQATAQHANVRSIGSSYELMRRFYAGRTAHPYEVRYGDDGPMAAEDLAPVYGALDEAEVALAWQRGDYLLIDNINVAHGRNPYRGARAVRVALFD
jgi:alpha-ketoglutarate-dependent taurine dioxygenase